MAVLFKFNLTWSVLQKCTNTSCIQIKHLLSIEHWKVVKMARNSLVPTFLTIFFKISVLYTCFLDVQAKHC
jgi:hypothetical protein